MKNSDIFAISVKEKRLQYSVIVSFIMLPECVSLTFHQHVSGLVHLEFGKTMSSLFIFLLILIIQFIFNDVRICRFI